MQGLTINAEKSLRERALGMLTRREYSRQEMFQKLSAWTEDDDEIHQLLDDFTQRGWLSEQRFSEQLVHARKQKFGSARVAHELRQHGVAEHLIEQALDEVKSNELAQARLVWQKKFQAAPVNREEWAKQARFLQGRGFALAIIKKVLNQDFEDIE